METIQTEQKQIWQTPELKVVDTAENTMAGYSIGGDGSSQS